MSLLQAAKVACEVLEHHGFNPVDLRQAIAQAEQNHSGEANEMVIDWEAIGKEQLRRYKEKFGDFEQAEQEPKCNPHPDAPHGFARNSSHNAGRYVCECEGWEPPKSGQELVAKIIESNIFKAWGEK